MLLYRYRQKFGFPFVICARENKKEVIVKRLTERVQNSVAEELNTGIEEVKKICLLRLLSIIQDSHDATGKPLQ